MIPAAPGNVPPRHRAGCRHLLAAVLLLAGCPGPADTTGGTVHTGTETGGGAGDPGPYPDSSLTPLAREVTALAWAALRGEELPRGGLRLAGAVGRVEGLPDDEHAAALAPVAFLARMDVGGEDGRWLKLAVLLSSAGLSVIQVEPRAAPLRAPGPAQPALLATARAVVTAMRGDTGTPPVPAPLPAVTTGLPPIDPAAVEGITAEAVARVDLDDLALIARSGDALYLLDVTVDHDDRGTVLGTEPLLRVQRVQPDAGQRAGVDDGPGAEADP